MIDFLPTLVFAQTGGASPNALLQLVPLLLVVAIFWLLILRPQQKRQSEHKQLLAALKKGDRVVTGGGIHGTIAAVKDDEGTVLLEVDQGVKILLGRSAIAGLLEARKKKA